MGRRAGGERQHMTTTVPCRGVSIIYIYNMYMMYIHVQHSRVCVCVSGCELIPERREREG